MTEQVPLEVDCGAVKTMLDDGTPMLLIDCREPAEHAVAHIAAARLIPLNQIPDHADKLRATKGPVVIHCHHGGRSLRAAEWLRQNGVAQAQSMAGGIHAWAETIDGSVPKY
jgi:rhodanese-related sulfurtransferase